MFNYQMMVVMAEKVLKIGCMDPRRRDALDEGDSLRISRAGGWLGGNLKYELPNILKEHGTERLEIRTHDQCGAVRVVHIGIRHPNTMQGSLYNAFVAPFLRYKCNDVDISTLEDIATKMQEEIANKILRQRGRPKSLQHISCKKATTSGIVEGKKILLLTPFSEDNKRITDLIDSLGLKNNSTYTITLVKGKLEEMSVDPQLALNHIGVSKVVLHAGSNDRHRIIDRFYAAIKRGDIKINNADVARYD